MTEERRESYTGLIPEDRVLEIDSNMLCRDLPIDVDLYLESGHYYTLYIRKDTLLDKGKLRHVYNTYKPVYLHILKEDKPAFDNYVTKSLETKLTKSGFTTEEKIAHLHRVGRKVIRDLWQDPQNKEYLGFVKITVQAMADLVLEAPGKSFQIIKKFKDPNYLWPHAVNMAFGLMELALRLEITDRVKLIDIGMGGMLHDIGKTAFVDEIIHKESPLLEGEKDQLMMHPRIGVEMMRETGMVSNIGLHIIGQHHELADGSGYPSGLKGNLMSLYSSMASVMEFYETMTSKRPSSAPESPLNTMRFMHIKKELFNNRVLKTFIAMTGMESSLYTDANMATGQTSFEDS